MSQSIQWNHQANYHHMLMASQVTVGAQLQLNCSYGSFVNGVCRSLLSWASFFFLFSFPCPWTYKFPFITSFSRPGPHHVEWSLYSREDRNPVDSAQWGLLLCCPVSRWLNISSPLFYCSRYAFLSLVVIITAPDIPPFLFDFYCGSWFKPLVWTDFTREFSKYMCWYCPLVFRVWTHSLALN